MPSREPELYKDKIEVSLDGRQIFYLFFGGAVIVGLVFVLGVMVGRRVEARGHLDRADTSAARDPLAALDRLERSDNLSYHGALTGAQTPTDVEKAIGELEKRRGAAAEVKPAVKPEVKPDVKPEAKPDVKPEAKPDAKPAVEARSEPVTHPDADKRDADKKSRKHDDGAKPDRDSKKASKSESATRSDARADAKTSSDSHADAPSDAGKTDARPSEAKTKFTLQLSSFQDRAEAEAFLAATKSAGFQPYLTEADVSGKGTFYRIRLGSYRSLEAANDAKAEYEKTSKKTAQVMRL
jgi:cell division protein FtsN